MRPILLVEDSTLFAKLVKKKIKDALDVPVVWTKSLAETKEALNNVGNGFELAVLDLNLPDASHGEVIPLVTGRGISSFVFTSDVNDELRQMVWSQQVADYIVKDDPSSLDYLVASMRQLLQNEAVLILIVDSSGASRNVLSELLYVRKYRVINAGSGEAALEILNQHPETRLVLCDAQLDDMEGYQLCRRIREKFKHNRMAIIGMVSGQQYHAGIRFLKSGVNELVSTEPLIVEELYAKLQFSLENVELLQTVSRAARMDPLTGLLNRQSFLADGESLFLSFLGGGSCAACLLLRPDRFSAVNNNYGYDEGDSILMQLAKILGETAGDSSLVARVGSTTFGMFFSTESEELACAYARDVAAKLSVMEFGSRAGGNGLVLNFSWGLACCCNDFSDGFGALLLDAEQELKAAMNR